MSSGAHVSRPAGVRRYSHFSMRPDSGAPRGSGSTLTSDTQVVRVRHVVGFVRDDWGEGNWTAKDLR